MNLIKTLGILVLMLIHFKVYSQEIDFNDDLLVNRFTPMANFDSEDLFKNKLESDFSFVGNSKSLDDQFSLDFTELSSQMKNGAYLQESFKVNSEMFSNYCGPLKDGLYIPVKGEDVIVGRLMDFVINEYVVNKLIFNKKY